MEQSSPTVRVTRSVRFSAAHRYHNPALSEGENERVFGRYHRPHGHGHNYRVDVGVEGPVDPVTGMVINLSELDDVLRAEVVDRLDHRFLNHEVEPFESVVPTCENLALHLAERLSGALEDRRELRLASIRVYESEDLFAEIAFEGSAR